MCTLGERERDGGSLMAKHRDGDGDIQMVMVAIEAARRW